MKEIFAYTASGQVFPMKIKTATLTRRYEDKEYAFVAGDLKLDSVDAAELYAIVNAGTIVTAVVKDGDQVKFRGSILREGSAFDPEREVYGFPVVHQSKRIFERAKKQLELNPSQTKDGTFPFDRVSNNYLRAFLICLVALDKNSFEHASPNGSGRDAYWTFLQEHSGYSTRDFWIDFAKHYRALLYVDNEASPVLHVIPRKSIASIVHTGYDESIAEYNEESRDPQYPAVFFPCQITIWNAAGDQALTLPCYATYEADGVKLDLIGTLPFGLRQLPSVELRIRAAGSAAVVPKDCLDLRVPNGMYGDNYPAQLPLESVPTFKFLMSTNQWSGESPVQYGDRHFYTTVRPFKELIVLYSLPVPVAPQEQLNVRGANAVITEVEDDLVDDTTKITGRIYP